MIYFFKKLFRMKGVAYRYDQLFNEVKKTKPKHIVEIGVWTGERALKMIRIAKKYNPMNSIHYYGFDLFESMNEEKFISEKSKQPPSIEFIEAKLNTTGINIHLFKGDTQDTLPKVVPTLPQVDLVFIDGGHSNETIANDWSYIKQLMNKNTVVIFDDYWPNRTDAGSKLTVDSIDRKEYSVSILPIMDSFADTSFGPLQIHFAKVVRI